MPSSNFNDMFAFLDGVSDRLKKSEEAIEQSGSLEELAANLGLDVGTVKESLPLFDTPEEAQAFADDPRAKILIDQWADFIVNG